MAAAKRCSRLAKRCNFRESVGLRVNELAKAQMLAEEHRVLIIQKWHEHLA
jgi:hypothetical protein